VLVGGHPPYGYDVNLQDGKFILVINKTESRIVKQIYHWFVVDGMAIRVIAKELNEMGVPTSSKPINGRRAKAWGGTTVRKILTNETYIGQWRYGKGNYRKNIHHPRERWIAVRVRKLITSRRWAILAT